MVFFRLILLGFLGACLSPLHAGDALTECTRTLQELAQSPEARKPFVDIIQQSNFPTTVGSWVVLPTSGIFVPALLDPFTAAIDTLGIASRSFTILVGHSTKSDSPLIYDFTNAYVDFTRNLLLDLEANIKFRSRRRALYYLAELGRPIQDDFHQHVLHPNVPRRPAAAVSVNAQGPEVKNADGSTYVIPQGSLLLFDDNVWHRSPRTVPPDIRRLFLFTDDQK